MRKFRSIVVPSLGFVLLSVAACAQPLVNLGLVGVGRIPANSYDAFGTRVDTLGGVFSGMALDLRTLTVSAGSYKADLWALADRGFGDGTTDFHSRVQTFGLTVTPYTGPFPAPSQNQVLFRLRNTQLFTLGYSPLTGYNPNDTSVAAWPQSPAGSAGMGARSLDPKGVVLRSDDGFFVADNYGPFIYSFDFLGEYEYELHPPEAYIPKSGASFGSRLVAYGNVPAEVAASDSGRSYDRGFGGLSLTPDGGKLVTILQTPLRQDGENPNTSRNTRILVFDVDPASPSFTQAVGEYVLELTLEGSEAKDRNTPVGELLALSDTDFLVLEGDNRGRGGEAGPVLYKKVVRVNVSHATNLLGLPGTPYDLEKGAPGQLSLPASGLPVGLVAATRSEVVNIANQSQLARFGLNGNAVWDQNTLSEKWTGLTVLPLNDPAAPGDFLLLIGNDNDFKASTVYHNGVIVGANTVTVDSMVLAFRVGEDHVAPTVSCPSTLITIAANPDCTLPDVTGLVTSSDNSVGAVQVSQSPAPGSPVPLNSPVQVTVVAVDASGNNSTPCSFFVNVLGPELTVQCPGPLTSGLGPDCQAVIPNCIAQTVAAGGCGAVTISQDPAAGTLVGSGHYPIAMTATDAAGQSNTCTVAFTVTGVAAPVVINLVPSRTTLWPPNHKLLPVSINVVAEGGCSAIERSEIVSVTIVEGLVTTTGATSPDWQVTGPLSLKLRAERAGTASDRLYVVVVRSTDAAGHLIDSSTTVTVPHDQQ